jgi:hypothetical protein
MKQIISSADIDWKHVKSTVIEDRHFDSVENIYLDSETDCGGGVAVIHPFWIVGFKKYFHIVKFAIYDLSNDVFSLFIEEYTFESWSKEININNYTNVL